MYAYLLAAWLPRLTMPQQITLKQGASPEQIDKYVSMNDPSLPKFTRFHRAKESAKAQGGIIRHEFTLIKGFT